MEASPAAADPRPDAAHWASAFCGAPEEALDLFGASRGRVLLVSIEGTDASSLHLMRHVWPDGDVQAMLRSDAVVPMRIDGGGEHAAAAQYWASELTAGVLPTIVLVYGARQTVCVRGRRLEPAYLVAKVRTAVAAASAAASSSAASRAEGMLSRYVAAAARDFRPPTPPPLPPTAQQLESQLNAAYAAELDAAYAASVEADEAADRERAAAAVAKAEAAAAAAEAEAARAAKAEVAQARREWRVCAAAQVPDEPAASDPSATNIAVRLRDGSRASRRFDGNAPLQLVADWVGGLTPDGASFVLASHYPRARFGEAEMERSLVLLGLHPAATLFVEEEEDGEEDEE